MKNQYVTPPYTEEMKNVCKVILNKFYNIVKEGVIAGKTTKEAQIDARKKLTQHINIPIL